MTHKPLTYMLLCGGVLAGLVVPTVRAQDVPIHRDCMDHRQPAMCTAVVNEVLGQLQGLNEMLASPDVDEFAAHYHDRATHSAAGGQFLRGRDEIRDRLLRGLVASVRSAQVDNAQFRFSVISSSLVIAYGPVPSTLVRSNGETVKTPPLIQTVTWIRNEQADPKRPFLMNSVHTLQANAQ